ncbi:MAG: aldehyde dehydrogenase family protein [Acidimicrobiia bacterium]
MQIFDTLFIGNEFVKPESRDIIDVVSPHTEQVIGQVPDASPADIDKAVAAARDAFDNGPWPTMPAEERGEAIARLSTALQNRAEELADLISSQNGSPKSWSIMGQVFSATMVLGGYAEYTKTRLCRSAPVRSVVGCRCAGPRSAWRRASSLGTCRSSSWPSSSARRWPRVSP